MQQKASQTIIVGMDGGFESAVTAYLLKKQGLSPIGVAVTFHESDPEFKEITSCFTPDKLENVKAICDILEIPFFATNATDSYFDKVVEGVLASRLSGNYYHPNSDRVRVILETLISKMSSLGASLVATGHYCKILKNQKTGICTVHRSNDIGEDDSYYFSGLEQDIIEKVIVPLSDLLQSEVVKLSKLIPYEFSFNKEVRRQERHDFMMLDELKELVEKYSSEKLRKEGQVVNYYEGNVIGDHLGIHQFYIGQKKIPLKLKAQMDKELVVSKIFPSGGVIYLDKQSRISFTHVYAKKFSSEKNLNKSVPLKVYCMLAPRGQTYECQISFKNNNFVFVKFNEKIEGFCPKGTKIVFYNKVGASAKILGSAVVQSSGFMDEDEQYLTMLKSKSQEEETAENKQKKKDLGF